MALVICAVPLTDLIRRRRSRGEFMVAFRLPNRLLLPRLLELIGGSMIILGLFTRPVAFVLSGQMAVAYWMAHAPRGPWPIQNGGELAVLFCFVYLFLFANGGGSFSLDGLRGRGKA